MGEREREKDYIRVHVHHYNQPHSMNCLPQIAACELLHAMVLFSLGRSAQPAMQNKVVYAAYIHSV